MNIFLEIAIAVLLCAAVFSVITVVSRAAKYPRRCRERVAAIVCVGKNLESLEHTVRMMLKMRDLLGVELEIILPEDELNDEYKRMANLLARDYGGIHVIPKMKLDEFLEELWRM